jgi:hypothetical protein
MKKIAVAIRGHERKSMSDDEFSEFIFELCNLYDVDIFLHTWDLSEASFSWRGVPKERDQINKGKILNYFHKSSKNIKKITVESDENIELHGRTFGRLGLITEIPCSVPILSEALREYIGGWANHYDLRLSSSNKQELFCFLQFGCPILSWKRMWHGIYSVIKSVNEYSEYDLVLNTRFDILRYKRTHNIGSPLIDFNLVKNLIDSFKKEEKIKFTTDVNSSCIDNVYAGSQDALLDLCYSFHYKLDEILDFYPPSVWEGIQEKLVFLEAQRIKNEH